MTEGWRSGRLIDFASVSTGPFGSLLHKSDYVSDGVPLVNPINIVGDQITPDPEKLIDQQTVSRLASYILRQGDIVVSRRGELGRCATIGSDESGWVCGTGCFFIRPGNDVEPRFLAAMLRSDRYRRAMEMASTGATMPSVSNTTLCNLPIAIPERNEQHRIVALLDEAFAGIATAKANAEKNLRNAGEVFQTARLRIFDGLKATRLRLGDITEVQSGGTPAVSKRQYWGGDIPWYSSGELNDLTTSEPERNISTEGLSASNAKLFPCESLLIGMYDTAALKMSILDREAAFNQAIAGAKPSSELDTTYLLHAISAQREELLGQRRGVRQKNLSLGKIKDILLPLPALAAQKQIVADLDALRSEVSHLESLYTSKLAALDELKQSLLQRAFSGAL